MKIAVKTRSYDDVMALKPPKHRYPMKPWWIIRKLLWLLATPFLWQRHTEVTYHDMDQLPNDQPCLILMNHSCFFDLKLAVALFHWRPMQIVCTSDGYVGFGMSLLMRILGCIPTQKFVSDPGLVRDIAHSIRKNRSSVLMYPEASYSFDGTATPLPESVGKLIKHLGVPVVTVITHGAFSHKPLYNELKRRKVDISADVTCLLTSSEIEKMTPADINAVLKDVFSFDNFAWQRDNQVKIDEPFRADGLNRVLYKCPHCLTEGKMVGKGITLTCTACGKTYTLTEYGALAADDPAFTHVPDWYAWERECVKQELTNGTYRLDIPVEIAMMVDYRAIYKVGTGRLVHTKDGFTLTGCDGALSYSQPPLASYSLYADYYWYQIADMISIGDRHRLYYCFPQTNTDVVAKTRLAAEELFKLCHKETQHK